jgi:hypothetical protein
MNGSIARKEGIAPISSMEEEIREAQLDEDHHTRLRYLSWLKKVENRWERQTATLHAGESHPILEAQKSLEKNSRLT